MKKMSFKIPVDAFTVYVKVFENNTADVKITLGKVTVKKYYGLKIHINEEESRQPIQNLLECLNPK